MHIKLLFILTLFIVTLSPVMAQTQTRSDKTVTQGASPDEVVDTFRLTAAYPNPFNPSTQFTLTIAREQHVVVEVYNLLGGRVDELFSGTMEAQQRYSFTFKADNLPSGLYLIRAAGEDFTTTQRITLLK